MNLSKRSGVIYEFLKLLCCLPGLRVGCHDGARGRGRSATLPARQRDELPTVQQAHSERSVTDIHPPASSCQQLLADIMIMDISSAWSSFPLCNLETAPHCLYTCNWSHLSRCNCIDFSLSIPPEHMIQDLSLLLNVWWNPHVWYLWPWAEVCARVHEQQKKNRRVAADIQAI